MKRQQISKEQKNLIIKMATVEKLTPREIHEATGVKMGTIYNHLAGVAGTVKKDVSGKGKTRKAKVKVSQGDTEEAADETEMDWKAWCIHFKDLYLKAHILLIENGIDPMGEPMISEAN